MIRLELRLSLTLEFPFRPVTFQKARFGKGRVYKTEKQQQYELQIAQILLSQILKLKEFAASFNPEIHVIQSSWVFLYEDIFTRPKKKNGSSIISSKCLDLDNSIKNIQDVIFRNLNIDDKFIVKTSSHKWKGEKDLIKCSFKIMKKDEIKFYFPDFEKIIE